MKVGIVTVQVPFVTGGAEVLAKTCKLAMLDRKIQAEIITIPFKWYPPGEILNQIEIARLLDLKESDGQKIDKLICLKFPAYYCPHPNKTLWLLHQHRTAYDLYDSTHGDLKLTVEGQQVAKQIKKLDNALIPEHRNVFTISETVANRLYRFNRIMTDEVLYPPPQHSELFNCQSYENFILFPSRFCALKRQELIVEAMRYVPRNLKLVLAGDHDNSYGKYIQSLIEKYGLQQQIILKSFISDNEKIDLYSRCLAVYNGVYDEDYGYVTLEAFLASKLVITHTDSGGPLEFVTDKSNGIITEPNPEAIATALNDILTKKNEAISYGKAGLQTLKNKNINWTTTIEKLLS